MDPGAGGIFRKARILLCERAVSKNHIGSDEEPFTRLFRNSDMSITSGGQNPSFPIWVASPRNHGRMSCVVVLLASVDDILVGEQNYGGFAVDKHSLAVTGVSTVV